MAETDDPLAYALRKNLAHAESLIGFDTVTYPQATWAYLALILDKLTEMDSRLTTIELFITRQQ